jgi:hypothetical protein
MDKKKIIKAFKLARMYAAEPSFNRDWKSADAIINTAFAELNKPDEIPIHDERAQLRDALVRMERRADKLAEALGDAALCLERGGYATAAGRANEALAAHRAGKEKV